MYEREGQVVTTQAWVTWVQFLISCNSCVIQGKSPRARLSSHGTRLPMDGVSTDDPCTMTREDSADPELLGQSRGVPTTR